jgi:hypothetical protein
VLRHVDDVAEPSVVRSSADLDAPEVLRSSVASTVADG